MWLNCPKQPEGELVHYLVRNEKQNKSHAYDKEVPNIKKVDSETINLSDIRSLLTPEVDLKTDAVICCLVTQRWDVPSKVI